MQRINLGRRISDLRTAIIRFEESLEVADLDDQDLDNLFWELYPISQFTFGVSEEQDKREALRKLKAV